MCPSCIRRLAAGALVVASSACGTPERSPVAPSIDIAPAYATCAERPDFVARDRDSFLQALENAQPGQTIAVDGMIEIDFDGNVGTPGLTFDCATPGSGLSAAPGVGLWLFIVRAQRVTVQNLVLDAREGYGAYLSDDNGVDAFAAQLAIRGNTVRCAGAADCIFVQTAEFAYGGKAIVSDNTVEASGGGYGIHVQGWDSATVTGNVVRQVASGRAGIGVNGSRHIDVTDNVVEGDWIRSVEFFDGVHASTVARNRLSGATQHAVLLQAVEAAAVTANAIGCGWSSCMLATGSTDVLVRDNTFVADGVATGVHFQGGSAGARVIKNRIVATAPSTSPAFGAIRILTGSDHVVQDNEILGPWVNGMALRQIGSTTIARNRIEGAAALGALLLDLDGLHVSNNVIARAGAAGIVVNRACGNVFMGNNLQNNAANRGLVFEAETGGNVFVGNLQVVVDNGDFDCDGDGQNDPNQLSGTGVAQVGPTLGGVIAEDVGSSSLR